MVGKNELIMNLSTKILMLLNGDYNDENTIVFVGKNNEKTVYNSLKNEWSNTGYFNVINPQNLQHPYKIFIYTSILEFLLSINKSFHFPFDFENSIVIISNQATNELLIDYLYSDFVSTTYIPSLHIYYSNINFEGYKQIIDVNNLLMKTKFLHKIENDNFYIFNSFFLPILLSFNNLDMVLKPFLNTNIKTIKIDLLSKYSHYSTNFIFN